MASLLEGAVTSLAPPTQPELTAPSRRLSFYYQGQIEATTSQLTADLDALSAQLTSLTASPAEPATYPATVPRRLPFTEQLKARVRLHLSGPLPETDRLILIPESLVQWNEKLAYGLDQVQAADVGEIAKAAWAKGKALLPQGGAGEEVAKP